LIRSGQALSPGNDPDDFLSVGRTGNSIADGIRAIDGLLMGKAFEFQLFDQTFFGK